MALTFFLDGYNIVKQADDFADLPLDAGRQKLIGMIERSPLAVGNRFVVVFDGRPGLNRPDDSSRVKICFTDEQSADDRIKDMVAAAKQPKVIVVVTNDRDIRYHVRTLGAAVWPVQEFVLKIKQRQGEGGRLLRDKSSGQAEGKRISATMEHAINQEFQEIWLKKSKNS